jgi:Fic family protein
VPSDKHEGASNEARPFALEETEAERIAQIEVENGFRQFDLGIAVIQTFLEPDRPFALRPSLIRQLQKMAVEGLEADAGEFRTTPVEISKSKHKPPPPHLVPLLVTEMCDYVNDNWHEKNALHLAAYVMWRHNWIHPFSEGNGRTSRVLSYIVLCIKLCYVLPGSPSIPQQIQNNRSQYFGALEQADQAFEAGQLDVSLMETALKNMLANQLLSVIEAADGKKLIFKE